VDLGLSGEHLERRQAQVVDRGHRPAVRPVGVDEAVRHLAPACGAAQQVLDVGAPVKGGAQHVALGRESRGCRRADRRILAAQQLLGFGRPGQELGVEHEPVRRQFLPQVGPRDGGADLVEQGELVGLVVQEGPAGAGHDRSCAEAPADTEPALGDLGVATDHHDGS